MAEKTSGIIQTVIDPMEFMQRVHEKLNVKIPKAVDELNITVYNAYNDADTILIDEMGIMLKEVEAENERLKQKVKSQETARKQERVR